MKKGESKEEGVLTAIESTKSIGLYKVQGEAVQAVIGGIFHQFVSQHFRLFFFFATPGSSPRSPVTLSCSFPPARICFRS